MVYSSKYWPICDHLYRVSKYEPYKKEIIITNIEFTNGMKFIDISRFKRLNPTLSIKVFEYSTDEAIDFRLFPLYIFELNDYRRIIDLILYKNHYILLKKLHVFIGKQDRRFECRNCLNSYTNQLELTTLKRLSGNNDKSLYLPCKENHVKWDKCYEKSP